MLPLIAIMASLPGGAEAAPSVPGSARGRGGKRARGKLPDWWRPRGKIGRAAARSLRAGTAAVVDVEDPLPTIAGAGIPLSAASAWVREGGRVARSGAPVEGVGRTGRTSGLGRLAR